MERVAERLAAEGVRALRLRRVLALLADGWCSLDELVRRPAVERRTVEELLAAAGDDLEHRGERWRLAPGVVPAYRERFALDALPTPVDPLAEAVARHAELLARIEADIAAVPPPLPAMDHVPATPESVLRRALWLAENHDLTGARVLFLGDHDLTSLAACAVVPGLQVTVVDLDERTLEFIDTRAAERGFDIRCLHADLRFGLPSAAREWADLVVSDPPYTPEGVGLFAARALSCLRDPSRGRVLLAYGFSDRAPALGLKVQQELLRLGLVFEAVLPDFDRYRGAQAVGSASSWYVCRPTLRRQRVEHVTRRAVSIYTHGPQSVEATGGTDEETLRAVQDLAAGPERRPVGVRQVGWDRPVQAVPGGALAVDASGDLGSWLLRVLLAVTAERVAVLVRDTHPCLGDADARKALQAVVGDRYRLRFLRGTPGPRHAVVLAEQVPPDELDPAGRLRRYLLDRAHGKPANVWREALVEASGGTLTKNQARQLVAEHARRAGLREHELAGRLIDLPRHRLAVLLEAASRG